MRSLVAVTGLCFANAAYAQTVKLVPPEQFKPLVEYSDTIAKCDTVRALGPLREGEHGYVLRFGSNQTLSRSVVAVWDSAGHLRSYSDARGDLRGPPTPIAQRGPQTSIMLDFQGKTALATNREHGTDHGLLLIFDEALKSEHLGSPLTMLERLHRQCGAPLTGTSTR